MSIAIDVGDDSPSDYVIVEPQSPSDVKVEILENQNIVTFDGSESDDYDGKMEVTQADDDIAAPFARDCFVCYRHFTDHNLFFIHLTVHKVDHTIWKAKNHKRSTMLKKELGGVDCIGCTFWYKAEECFVSMCGNRYVCTFCYDATRLDHCRKYGVRKDGTFPYENFLLSDDMKQESNSAWKPAQMRLNKEEKIARINEILKELRQSPQIPLESLLTKWAITQDDFDRYRSDRMTKREGKARRSTAQSTWTNNHGETYTDKRTWTEKANDDTLVCPVTKIPLGVIAKIRGVLKDQKYMYPSESSTLDELLRKWEVDRPDYNKYKAMIDRKTDPITIKKQPSNPIKPKTSIAKSLLNSKNVYKVATIPVSLASKPSTNGSGMKSNVDVKPPPNVVIMPKNSSTETTTLQPLQFDIAKLTSAVSPFLMTPTTSETPDLKRMHEWLTYDARNYAGKDVYTWDGRYVAGKQSVDAVRRHDGKLPIEKLPTAERNNRTDANRVKRLKKSENKCVNCGTHTATLWRRIKSPQEIEAKRPYVKAQTNRLEYTGKLACNSCALYWSLHGKHRQTTDIQNDQPRKRNRKRTFERLNETSHIQSPATNVQMNDIKPFTNPLFGPGQLNPELERTLLQLWQIQSQNIQKQAEMTETERSILPYFQHLNYAYDPASALKRTLDELENGDEPASIGSAESNDSQTSAPKIPKTEFVEEDEIICASQDDDSEPIDYSMSTDDTASEVEKPTEKQLDSFQMFCHVCLKILRCGNKGWVNDRKVTHMRSDELPLAQCFMCPRAIYCKTCIYSINHLKLHTGINVDIPLNKTD